MTRLLFVVNHVGFFVSHRLGLALRAKSAGFDVQVAAGPGPLARKVAEAGLPFHEIPLSRAGRHPQQEFTTFRALLSLYERLRPDIVHHVTIKPVLYGSMAAQMAQIPFVVNAISGLGHLFVGNERFSRPLRRLALAVTPAVFSHPNMATIFQNEDDRQLFLERRSVHMEQTWLIRGSGVDTDLFSPGPEPTGPPRILLPARMLYDKGVMEFVAAASILKRRGTDAEFVLAGDVDDNPSTVNRRELETWTRQGRATWLGHRDDMPALLRSATIVCLPSYREGLPKSLIEAASTGRAIVTTDVPGCRDVVRHNENGLLVPPRDSERLAEAIAELLADRDKRIRFGHAGRTRALDEFSFGTIAAQTLELYATLQNQRPRPFF